MSTKQGFNADNKRLTILTLARIISADYLKSKWCMQEVDYFISLGKRDRILAVLVSGEPSDSFPPQVCRIDDNGEEAVPLAADIRASKKYKVLHKIGKEKLRVLAPMFNVGFDELFRRNRRKIIKMTALFSVLTLIILYLFVTLAITSMRQIESEQKKNASEQIQKLIFESSYYRNNGDKTRAVQCAAQAVNIAKTKDVDLLEATA